MIRIAFCVTLVCLLGGCQSSKEYWTFEEKIYTQNIFPYGIAMDDGQIVVSSMKNDRTAIIGLDGRILKTEGNVSKPMRLSKRSEGLIIAEFGENRVAIKRKNEVIYYPMLEKPNGATAADMLPGRFAVTDYEGHRIIYYHQGKDMSFGGKGVLHGKFNYPTDVQFYGNQIYVADNQNKRVEVFDEAGNYEKSIGDQSQILSASGIFVWSGGIVVCDRVGGKVLFYGHDGTLLQTMDEGFEKPTDAMVFGHKLYVSDEIGGYIAVLDGKRLN